MKKAVEIVMAGQMKLRQAAETCGVSKPALNRIAIKYRETDEEYGEQFDFVRKHGFRQIFDDTDEKMLLFRKGYTKIFHSESMGVAREDFTKCVERVAADRGDPSKIIFSPEEIRQHLKAKIDLKPERIEKRGNPLSGLIHRIYKK